MIIHIANNPGNLPPDEVSGITELRSRYDCIWSDSEAINVFNPRLLLADTADNFKLHPLRLIWTSLSQIDFNKNVYCDSFRRNTIVLALDADVLEHESIAHELEKHGIALLMAGKNQNSVESVLKSLASLRLKSILIEGSDVSKKLFRESMTV